MMRCSPRLAALAACLLSLTAVSAQQGPLLSGTSTATFTTPPTACDVAIVGGGPGGVYAAHRLLESGAVSDATAGGAVPVCLFEQLGRVGGRVYSIRNAGDNKDLTVETGAYRYNRRRMGIVTDIIERLLKLPHRFYQPGNADYHVIERPDGTLPGFTTFVEGLLTLALDRGLNITFRARVNGMDQAADGFRLRLQSGQVVTARSVILNLPVTPLHRLLTNSNLPNRTHNPQLFAPYPVTGGKVYLYYSNAWWVQQGLTRPQFIDSPTWPPVQFPFSGRFYDGEVRCPISGDARGRTRDYVEGNSSDLNLAGCYGFLQVFYEAEHGPLDVYYPDDRSFQPFSYLSDYAAASDPDVPYYIQTNKTPDGRALLSTAHTRLINLLEDIGYNLTTGLVKQLPTQAVVVVWNEAVTWAGGGWHDYKDANLSSIAKVASAVQPFPDLRLFVANEAYSRYQHWAEGSLIGAENIVRTHFNASVPAWMRPSTAQNVIYGPNYRELNGFMER